MDIWDRVSLRIGALPAKRVTWGLVLVFSAWVLLDVFVFKLTGGVPRSTYDAMVRARFYAAAPDPRIVIVDVDEASLARMGKDFGRWPWPRDTLATVLDHVEKQQPAAVVWDLVFSDADRINPGGDVAFNEAVKRSTHSHFSVVRLPKENDSASQIVQTVLPGLWLGSQTPGPVSTVAMIAPVLPAVAAGRLGYNNGYVDDDGVLRRYRYMEMLPDGSAIQSLPLSVALTINSTTSDRAPMGESGLFGSSNTLIAWRQHADAYPHIPFADVFAQAEGGKPLMGVPSFTGKVVIMGATAPSLHDIHPTPLSSMQAGVESLAAVLDNAINKRQVAELPRAMQAAIAIALCIGLALWVQFKSVASLAPALFALPAVLLGLGYLSLNGLSTFVDLHLAAALALVFLTVLRVWSTLRRIYWCTPPVLSQPLAIWPWERRDAWLEGPLDRLIDAVERYAPNCRVVVCDSSVTWPATLRWPELARFAAVVGPLDAMIAARGRLEPALKRLAQRCGEPTLLDPHSDRDTLAKSVFRTWAGMQAGKRDNK
jgi:CHASE2 domain-containing sensor protein